MIRRLLIIAALAFAALPIGAADLISSDLGSRDLHFIRTSSRLELERVSLATVANKRAESAELRAFAEGLTATENDFSEPMKVLAEAKGIKPDPGNNPAAEKALDRLELLNGAKFEKAWLAEFIASYQQAAAAARSALDSEDRAIRVAAQKLVPRYEAYLGHARKLAGTSTAEERK